LLGIDEFALGAEKSEEVIELLEILVEDVVSHHDADMISRD
jgi:hypothetical protein